MYASSRANLRWANLPLLPHAIDPFTSVSWDRKDSAVVTAGSFALDFASDNEFFDAVRVFSGTVSCDQCVLRRLVEYPPQAGRHLS